MIALTNLALGYTVAAQLGFGPKSAELLTLAAAQDASEQPTFAILGGNVDEIPLSELPPSQPVEDSVEPGQGDVPNETAAESPDSQIDLTNEGVPAEVQDFASSSVEEPVQDADDNVDNDMDDSKRTE